MNNTATIQRALIALTKRIDDEMWPLGSSIVTGTNDVTEEIDSLGDTDPEEHNIPVPLGIPKCACLIVWTGTVSKAGWVGTFRLATPDELHALQNGHLLAHWHWLDAKGKTSPRNQEELVP